MIREIAGCCLSNIVVEAGHWLTTIVVYDRPVRDDMITCLTPPISGAVSTESVLVRYDNGATRTLTSTLFTYYDNPIVDDVTPLSSYRR